MPFNWMLPFYGESPIRPSPEQPIPSQTAGGYVDAQQGTAGGGTAHSYDTYDTYDARRLMDQLYSIDTTSVPEVVVTDEAFNKIQILMGGNPKDKFAVYDLGRGPLTIRNKKYILTLDDFMEDVPNAKLP